MALCFEAALVDGAIINDVKRVKPVHGALRPFTGLIPFRLAALQHTSIIARTRRCRLTLITSGAAFISK